MKKFKKLVRAISPFSGKRSRSNSLASETLENKDGFEWDISNVDLHLALNIFYRTYIPEKVGSVQEILFRYRGDEQVMLNQLCERYNLTFDQMNNFLEKAKKKSGSKTSHEDEKSSVGSKNLSYKYDQFYWDLSNVDVAHALTLVYGRYIPNKSPNLKSLEGKSSSDLILILQQLCKRHSMNEMEMQAFLNRSTHSLLNATKRDAGKKKSVKMAEHYTQIPPPPRRGSAVKSPERRTSEANVGLPNRRPSNVSPPTVRRPSNLSIPNKRPSFAPSPPPGRRSSALGASPYYKGEQGETRNDTYEEEEEENDVDQFPAVGILDYSQPIKSPSPMRTSPVPHISNQPVATVEEAPLEHDSDEYDEEAMRLHMERERRKKIKHRISIAPRPVLPSGRRLTMEAIVEEMAFQKISDPKVAEMYSQISGRNYDRPPSSKIPFLFKEISPTLSEEEDEGVKGEDEKESGDILYRRTSTKFNDDMENRKSPLPPTKRGSFADKAVALQSANESSDPMIQKLQEELYNTREELSQVHSENQEVLRILKEGNGSAQTTHPNTETPHVSSIRSKPPPPPPTSPGVRPQHPPPPPPQWSTVAGNRINQPPPPSSHLLTHSTQSATLCKPQNERRSSSRSSIPFAPRAVQEPERGPSSQSVRRNSQQQYVVVPENYQPKTILPPKTFSSENHENSQNVSVKKSASGVSVAVGTTDLNDDKKEEEARERMLVAETAAAAERKKFEVYIRRLLHDIDDQKDIIKQYEEKEKKLEYEWSEMQEHQDELERQVNELDEALAAREADKRDVLQLVDIMSSSPVAVKTIVKSYLKQLGTNTGNLAIALGVDKDGNQIPIAERINMALMIKREQEREVEGLLSNKKKPRSSSIGSSFDQEDEYDRDKSITDYESSTSENETLMNLSEGEKLLYKNLNKHMKESVKKEKMREKRIQEQINDPKFRKQQELLKRKENEKIRQNEEKQPRNISRSRSPSPGTFLKNSPKGFNNSNKGESRKDQILDNQYDLAKKYYEHQRSQLKISSQLAEANLSLQAQESEKMIDSLIKSDKKQRRKEKEETQISSRIPDKKVLDWVECFDPRSNRHYYYSPSLKKSTWKKPGVKDSAFVTATENLISSQPTGTTITRSRSNSRDSSVDPREILNNSSSSYNSPSRYQSPQLARFYNTEDNNNSAGKMTSSELKMERPGRSKDRLNSSSRSLRDYSPMSSTSSRSVSASSRNGLAARDTESSARRAGRYRSPSPQRSAKIVWVTAIDPKTQRRYWYNRETKVSTWRKPAELI